MANTWDDSIRPFLLRRSDDIESIWVGGKDGSKWCEVGTPSEIASSQIQEYANSTGKCFGKTSYIRVNAVDGCDVFKRGEKSLIAFKGEQIAIVVVLKGEKPEFCINTLLDIVAHLRKSNIR